MGHPYTPAISPAYFHCVGVSVNLGHIFFIIVYNPPPLIQL